MNSIALKPNASSLVESLRDIGYSLDTAIADIIDNSITANAKNINIFFDTLNELKVAILDDGYGMTSNELINAMKIGSKNPLEHRDNKDLGRFGLGLKTASFSQCRKLTVISKVDGVVSGTRWDLDKITDDWNLEILSSDDIEITYKSNELQANGTLVVWENTDRIIDTTIKKSTEDLIYEKFEYVKKHLELVFHRYLAGETGKIKKVNILINGDELKPFDPFNKKNDATDWLSSETIEVNGKKIIIQPYILPHHSKMSKKEYDYYEGVGGYLKNQGFYIYRNARLLIHGTWFGIIRQKELYKLARVQIDLPNDLDHIWKIDVKKSMASPPEVIRERLKNIIDQIINRSFRVYEGRGRDHKKLLHPFWKKNVTHGEISYLINKEHPFISEFEDGLNATQKLSFNSILTFISDFFPVEMIYADYGSHPEKFIKSKSDEELEQIAIEKIAKLKTKFSKEDFIDFFKCTEPTNKYSKSWKDFVETNYE